MHVLPAGQVLQSAHVFGIGEAIVSGTSRDETRVALLAAFVRHDEFLPVPAMADAAKSGGGVKARTPGTVIRSQLRTEAADASPRATVCLMAMRQHWLARLDRPAMAKTARQSCDRRAAVPRRHPAAAGALKSSGLAPTSRRR